MNGFDAGSAETELCEICEVGTATLGKGLLSTAYRGEALQYSAPVWACNTCGNRYTAEGAEMAEQDAIRDHLQRMRPAQIRALRERLGLSQAAFAVRVRTSRDSVIRWEAGTHVQTRAADDILKRVAREPDSAERRKVHNDRFKFDVSDRAEAASHFELRA